jgi:hypothetical protein
MRRTIIIVAALAAFVALAVAATLTSSGGDKAPAHTAAQAHTAPSHSRAFWVVHHKQP